MIRVHVFVLPLEREDPRSQGELIRVLDADELERAARLRSHEQFTQFVAAHALRRLALSSAIGGNPSGWRFAPDARGRPVAAFGAERVSAESSLAHTNRMVGVAVGADGRAEIGFDLEALDHEVKASDFAGVLTPGETRWLREVPSAELNMSLIRLWTLKESYSKAVGRGLRLDFSTLGFEFHESGVRLSDRASDDVGIWFFEQRDLPGGIGAALALRRPTLEHVRCSWTSLTAGELVEQLRVRGDWS